ncbi:hypothetical protein [Brevibacterium aurantiacum]|uniref:Holin n=1 Tax=Brevibacterium aurantiacum TaxID=273384 RepID=A0A2H1IK29_BREAU|nr:hypothetical protein [Brevibacterium aurantiacum]SMX75496.1 hypothetical protein BAURA63_01302 [Brevibacterium aurantiacum]
METKPSAKTGITVLAGAIVTVLVWIATLSHVEVPGEVAAAVTTIIAGIVGYLVPARSGKHVELDATPVPDDYEPKH